MTKVKYTICSQVEKRKKLLLPKFDGLQKHASCHKATFPQQRLVVDEYYRQYSQHLKNE
jgi:hypothetical protein